MSTAKPLADLTRWNRTGLSRFDYVDGDASVWLEELRIAMLGLYLRGGDPETRLPQHWRDIYLRDQTEWPDATDAADRVVWKRLAPDVPPQRETRGRRNERLLRQYDERTDDYTWEINRAFARASHILLGYLDAYANEGYLRTATQWDNLRRLAAMVNYQPTPPASAITTVGLILNEEADDVAIPAGLAMKHTPPEGGAPMIFETLQEVSAHPALNAARVSQWNENHTSIPLLQATSSLWHLDEDKSLATGDLAVLATGGQAEPLIISDVSHDTDDEEVGLKFSDVPSKTYDHYRTRLWVHPGDVRVGLKTSKNRQVVVESQDLGAAVKGDLVEVFVGSKANGVVVEILAEEGGEIVLDMDLPEDGSEVSLRLMQPYALDNGKVERIPDGSGTLWVPTSGAPASTTGSTITPSAGEIIPAGMKLFSFSNAQSDRAFAKDTSGAKVAGMVLRKDPQVLPGSDNANAEEREKGGFGSEGPSIADKRKRRSDGATVSFEGKPPKGMADGDWFVARDMATDQIQALRIKGIRVASGEYHVEFSSAPSGSHNRTEFHGPMTLDLPHTGYLRNPAKALVSNKVTLVDIPEPARVLIKPGRTVLIRRQYNSTDQTVAARVEEARPLSGNRLELTLVEYEDAKDWARGDTTFALNTVQISHGESKDSKLLGSGDGERRSQVFTLDVKNVSHIPSTAAEAGVVPDMTIAVDGERWDYRDFIDPSAAETKSWSTTLTDSGTLRVHFRRRLVTGQNNIVVSRYRVGAGASGSNILPLSFAKPMKKHRHVAGVFQPFATAGGADREPVSKLRQSTPKRLSANGRAVALPDFEHLATRHASILRAHAELVPTSGSQRMVSLTVALTSGGSVSTIAADLVPSITARALPGVGVSFRDYEHLPLHMAVTVRSDLSVHNRTDIKAAAQARLTEVFSLENRDFGQTAYISEVLAALETVDGIENAIVDDFDLGQNYDLLHDKPTGFTEPWPRNVATVDGKVAAIYATDHQIIHIATPAPGAVAIEVETTQ